MQPYIQKPPTQRANDTNQVPQHSKTTAAQRSLNAMKKR